MSTEDRSAPDPSPELREVVGRQKSATNRLATRTAQAKKSKASRGLSRVNTNAALEYARTVDLVEWLVTHQTERDQLSSVVELLVEAAETLLGAVPERRRAALRKRILDHLWCDLVASVVRAVEMVGNLESAAKDQLAEVVADTAVEFLAEARAAEEGKPATKPTNGKARTRADLDVTAGLTIESATLQGCVRGVTRIALDGATAALDANLKFILLKMRVAALMLCPDVMAHDLVYRHCWLPMWHDAVFDAALEELADFVNGLKPSLELTRLVVHDGPLGDLFPLASPVLSLSESADHVPTHRDPPTSP